MRKKLSIYVLALMVALAFMPAATFAQSAPQMTAYNQVIKEGNTAYVAGAAGIYKVKLKKNGKVKNAKRIYKSYAPMGKYSYVSDMYKQDDYVYFLLGTEGTTFYLNRVSTSGKAMNLETLNDTYYGYSIDGDKIYYSTFNDNWDDDWDDDDWDDDEYWDDDWDDDEYWDDDNWDPSQDQILMQMNLDGTAKTETTITPNEKSTKTTTSGYSRVIKKKGKYLKDYLKTPKGTFYLGKIKQAR